MTIKTTLITAASSSFRTEAMLYVSGVEGASPPPADIVPAVLSVNGATYGNTIHDTQSIILEKLVSIDTPDAGTWPLRNLVISGTDLNHVTAVQIEHAGEYLIWRGDSNGMGDISYPNFYQIRNNDGVIVLPSEGEPRTGYVGLPLSFSYSAGQITIGGAALSGLSTSEQDLWSTQGNSLFPRFRAFQFPSNAFSYVNNLNDFATFNQDSRDLMLSDFWWSLRLWYASGSKFIRPYAFLNFMQPESLLVDNAIDPSNPIVLNAGETGQASAILRYPLSSSELQTVTSDSDIFWYSGDETIATVDNVGTVTGIAGTGGTTYVFAEFPSIWSNTGVQVDVAPSLPGGLAAFVISGNPSYLTSSASTYLEAYPMWKGTNAVAYATASTATPNPPKTGHAAFGYNSSTGQVTVSSSGSPYRWDGGWNPDVAANASPWQYPEYAMTNPGAGRHYLTKGYAGPYFSGSATTNDGVNWIALADVDRFANKFVANASASLAAQTASTNYYAQTLTSERDALTNTTTTYQISMIGGGLYPNRAGRIVHIVAYGSQTGTFTNLSSITLETNRYTDGQLARAPSPLNFKKVSNSELLVWLPFTLEADQTTWSPMWTQYADLYNDVNFIFTNNDASESSFTVFRTFNGA